MAATFNHLQKISNRALHDDHVAAYGHQAETALIKRLRMPTTDISTRQYLQEKTRDRLVVT
jgi:hypothetical protein